jgi:hypothetical protein
MKQLALLLLLATVLIATTDTQTLKVPVDPFEQCAIYLRTAHTKYCP